MQPGDDITTIIGKIPYRMALAGGWIDQPFISQLNPTPPGSMVVVRLSPSFRFMNRCGMATSTRNVALSLWGDTLPEESPESLVRALYQAENQGKSAPSGSQDMAGLIYPGVSRLDYDARVSDGVFPSHVETCTDPTTLAWLEAVIHVLPVNSRPDGYDPLGIQHLEPAWVQRLGESGKSCYRAILDCDTAALGNAFNECMTCWETLLPQTVCHPTIPVNLLGILRHYQNRYAGAMYSGCGGGYLFVVSDKPVPGSFQVQISA